MEVSPSYDTVGLSSPLLLFINIQRRHYLYSLNSAELTGLAAADIVHDFLNMMQLDAPPSEPKTRDAWKAGASSESSGSGSGSMKEHVKGEL